MMVGYKDAGCHGETGENSGPDDSPQCRIFISGSGSGESGSGSGESGCGRVVSLGLLYRIRRGSGSLGLYGNLRDCTGFDLSAIGKLETNTSTGTFRAVDTTRVMDSEIGIHLRAPSIEGPAFKLKSISVPIRNWGGQSRGDGRCGEGKDSENHVRAHV